MTDQDPEVNASTDREYDCALPGLLPVLVQHYFTLALILRSGHTRHWLLFVSRSLRWSEAAADVGSGSERCDSEVLAIVQRGRSSMQGYSVKLAYSSLDDAGCFEDWPWASWA